MISDVMPEGLRLESGEFVHGTRKFKPYLELYAETWLTRYGDVCFTLKGGSGQHSRDCRIRVPQEEALPLFEKLDQGNAITLYCCENTVSIFPGKDEVMLQFFRDGVIAGGYSLSHEVWDFLVERWSVKQGQP